MIITKERETPGWNTQQTKQKGKLEPKRFYHAIKYTFTVQYTYIIQACYDLPINTLRLIRIHITWSDSVDACTCGGLPCSPLSYVLQVLQ